MREIAGRIATDAVIIAPRIGLVLGGRGAAYITEPEFESPEAPADVGFPPDTNAGNGARPRLLSSGTMTST